MGPDLYSCSCQSSDGHEDVQIGQAKAAPQVDSTDDADADAVAGKEQHLSPLPDCPTEGIAQVAARWEI